MPTTKKKHLVIYTENYVYGGLERFLFDLINNIHREKYKITFLYNNNPDFDTRFNRFVNRSIEKKSLPIYTIIPCLQRLEQQTYPRVIKFVLKAIYGSLNYLFFVGNILLLSREFSRYKIDTLYVINGGYPGAGSCLAAVIAGKLHKVPRVVLSILSYPYPRKLSLLEKPLDSLISQLVSIVITNSNAARRGMIKLRNFPPAKLQVIHTGVKENLKVRLKMIERIRRRYRLSSSVRVVGMVGAFEPYKGHKYLIESIPFVKREFPNVKFVLVGEGKTKKEIEDYVQSQGLSKDVIFTGYYPAEHIVDLIGVFDLLVLPSLHEGLPYVISEAMSLGKPVVATKVGGIPEQITHGVSGILVPPKNPKAIAEGIVYLLKNKKKAKEMVIKARKKVKNSLSLELMVSSIEKLL